MRPAYGMGRRSFSRPGALRFTAAPCSRLAKRRAVQQGGRPAIHSGAAPLHNNPRRPAAQPHLTAPDGQRRSPTSQQPPATGGTAPTSRLPRDRSRNGGQTDMAATRRAAVPCALLHKPAGPSPLAVLSHTPPRNCRAPPSSRITPRNCRAPPSTAVQPRFTTTLGRRAPAPSCINPPGHRPSAPSCIIPRNRRAPPSPRITRRATAPLRPLA